MFLNVINLSNGFNKDIFEYHNESVVKCMHIDSNSKLKLTLDVFK